MADGQVGSSFGTPWAMVTSTTVAGMPAPIVPWCGAETCSRGLFCIHPSSLWAVGGTPGTRWPFTIGYTSSQNSTEFCGVASSVRENSPVLSSWMLHGALGVTTIWLPKNHCVL